MPLVEPVTIADLPNKSAMRIGAPSGISLVGMSSILLSIKSAKKKKTRGMLGRDYEGPGSRSDGGGKAVREAVRQRRYA
jgi:hypothetical protein